LETPLTSSSWTSPIEWDSSGRLDAMLQAFPSLPNESNASRNSVEHINGNVVDLKQAGIEQFWVSLWGILWRVPACMSLQRLGW
jgi:hypothetical protein